jgi:hypothetical protein
VGQEVLFIRVVLLLEIYQDMVVLLDIVVIETIQIMQTTGMKEHVLLLRKEF